MADVTRESRTHRLDIVTKLCIFPSVISKISLKQHWIEWSSEPSMPGADFATNRRDDHEQNSWKVHEDGQSTSCLSEVQSPPPAQSGTICRYSTRFVTSSPVDLQLSDLEAGSLLAAEVGDDTEFKMPWRTASIRRV